MTETSREALVGILDQAEAKIRRLYVGGENVHITVDPRSRGVENFLSPLRDLRAGGYGASVVNAVCAALSALASRPNADIVSESMHAFLSETQDPEKIKAMSTFVRVLAEKNYLGSRQNYFSKVPRNRDKELRAQLILNGLGRKIG